MSDDLVNIPRKLFDETMARAAACVSNKKSDHVQFGAFDNIDGERLLEVLAETVTTLRAAARTGPGGCACLATVTAERDEARSILAGGDAASLPHDWTVSRVAQARMDDIHKYVWQVRDTCKRAEKAEAERDEAIAALRNLVRHDQADDARNRQPNCIELHEAIAILSKHPQKVTT